MDTQENRNVLDQYGQQKSNPITQQHILMEKWLEQLRPPLKVFINEIMDSNLGKRLSSLPASRNHHHNQEGGLLTHSLECAMLAGQVALLWLNRPEAEVTMVAAFLHDIGKVATSPTGSSDPSIGVFITHEAYALELLAPFMAGLEERWPLGANLLRHMLSKDNPKDHFPAFPGKLLVKMADHFSTAIDRRATIFKEHPSFHYFAYDPLCKQKYLRIPH